ncbi:MAG: phage tail protein [Bacteroidetes bacterium]|nr:phage tail protein [Bacteroidota bacterium]
MKNILFILFLIPFLSGTAQNSVRGFNYQAVARDANGAARKNEPVIVRFSLLNGSANGTAHWVEQHNVNTDLFGAFSVVIGSETRQSGYSKFSLLSFTANNYWLKVETIDGPDTVLLSNEPMQSVPYAENGVAPGIVHIFGGPEANIPEGWLICDGRSLSRTAYPDLFEAIGTAWGSSCADSFNIPDMRGMFLRGVSGNSGNDPDTASTIRVASRPGGNSGNKVGSMQPDAFQKHKQYRNLSHVTEQVWWWGGNTNVGNHQYGNRCDYFEGLTIGDIHPEAVNGGGEEAHFSSETRPKNANVYYIIKSK